MGRRKSRRHQIEYPAILDYPAPRLRAYHPATVVADKLNATVVLGAFNSRVKDLPDIALLATVRDIDGEALCAAIDQTFKHRATHPVPESVPADTD